jgi:hypothetical protein
MKSRVAGLFEFESGWWVVVTARHDRVLLMVNKGPEGVTLLLSADEASELIDGLREAIDDVKGHLQ